ncbi:Uncharacterised protein [uncultured archaeon]|nr:Uncharacterised protein [uncultured archaeon]
MGPSPATKPAMQSARSPSAAAESSVNAWNMNDATRKKPAISMPIQQSLATAWRLLCPHSFIAPKKKPSARWAMPMSMHMNIRELIDETLWKPS